MKLAKATITLLFLLMLSGCDSPMPTPKKPSNVPVDAVWSGGPDGGHWFDCKKKGDDKFNYNCVIYNDHNGEVIAQGAFVLRKSTWDESKGRATYSATGSVVSLAYNYYDGQLIHLKESLTLLPHGLIEHPFGDGHGKRQEYNLGVPVGEEKSY